MRLSPAADDPYQAAVARVGCGGGAQRQDLVAAPAQGTQVSGQAGSPPAQVERLIPDPGSEYFPSRIRIKEFK